MFRFLSNIIAMKHEGEAVGLFFRSSPHSVLSSRKLRHSPRYRFTHDHQKSSQDSLFQYKVPLIWILACFINTI